MGARSLVLKVENITKTYKRYKNQELLIFENSSFKVFRGEAVAIVGASGCGKTTLLQVCGLLDDINSGQISINSVISSNLSKKDKTKIRRKNIGFIYQMHHLLAEFTALENVMLPLLVNNIRKKIARENAVELLEKLGLYDKISSMPSELSGGEKQRVAIARAIANRPLLILADEPTGNLDSENSEKIVDILLGLTHEFNLGLLMVTHDLAIAKRTDKILTIEDKKIVNY